MLYHLKTKAYRIIKDVRFLSFCIAILFAVTWIDLARVLLDILPLDIITFTIFIVPIVLLVLCIQYNSHRAYFAVITLFMLSIILNVARIHHLIPVYLEELRSDSWYHDDSFCPICDIINNLKFIVVAVIGIAMLHNSLIVYTYRWRLKSFAIAILNCGLLYLIIKMCYMINLQLL